MSTTDPLAFLDPLVKALRDFPLLAYTSDLAHDVHGFFKHHLERLLSSLSTDHISDIDVTAQHLVIIVILLHLLAGLSCAIHLLRPKDHTLITPRHPVYSMAEEYSPPKTPSRRQAIPPHISLLRHIYPTTSLWPRSYLRAFNDAFKGDGLVRLSREVVEMDLREGKVGMRGNSEVSQIDFRNFSGVGSVRADEGIYSGGMGMGRGAVAALDATGRCRDKAP